MIRKNNIKKQKELDSLEKVSQSITVELISYYNSMPKDKYFEIETEKAKELEVLPILTYQLCKRFGIECIYFRKDEGVYFDKISKREVVEYIITEFINKAPKELDWDSDPEKRSHAELSRFFLWINKGIKLILDNPEKASVHSTELIANLFYLESRPDVLIEIIDVVILYIKNYHESSGHLRKLSFDLKVISKTYQDLSKKERGRSNNDNNVYLYGKKLNLKERFLISNKVLGIENKIRTLKISENEKHILLSLILGCNIDNAKKIMSDKYDAKVKEDLLNEYFDTLIQ